MTSKTKTAVIIALCLLGIGFIFTIVAVASGATMEKAAYIVDKRIGHNENSIDIYDDWNNDNEGTYYMEGKELILSEESFSVQSVKRLIFDIAAAEAQIIPGERFSVRAENVPCAAKLDNGTLTVKTKNPRWNWPFRAPWRQPKIIITIPENVHFESVSIEVGAGSFVSKSAAISCNSAQIEVGMGECILYNFSALKKADIECGMGSMEIRGTITGTANINCGMGSIDMSLKGNPLDYSYTASVGMGSVRVNTTELNGIGGKTQSPYQGKHDLEIDCGMGAINVQIAE